ncbi:MAG: sigma-70 family RNA polymerase sigma factor [Bacteroidia bacterium]|nr:sigma-70 family RNA polymerase sigma factor [Bacteroidia bacterium]
MNTKAEKAIKEKIALNPEDSSILPDILRYYQKDIYFAIRRMVLTHEDADDVLQEVMVKVWLNLKNFKGESSLFTWIYRIAINESMQFLRKKKIKCHENPDAALKASDCLKSDPYFKGEQIQAALFDAVNMLPEKQRLVFQMRYFEEMPYEQIAEITGTSVGALKASFHHAMEKMEAYLREKSQNIIIQ